MTKNKKMFLVIIGLAVFMAGFILSLIGGSISVRIFSAVIMIVGLLIQSIVQFNRKEYGKGDVVLLIIFWIVFVAAEITSIFIDNRYLNLISLAAFVFLGFAYKKENTGRQY
jgi:hypothetical protein